MPQGRFLTGAIRLRSNVNLHLADGVRIAFHSDPAEYLAVVLTRFEGTELMYDEGKNGAFKPILRDVEVRNVTSRKSKHAFLLRGFADSPITNIRVSDCTFDGVGAPDVLEGVRDLALKNVRINGQRRDETINR